MVVSIETFAYELLKRVGADCSRELWEHLRETQSPSNLLRLGIRPELYEHAVADVIAPRVLEQGPEALTRCRLVPEDIHPQFADLLWGCVRRQVFSEPDGTLRPAGELYLSQYGEMLEKERVVRLVVTDTVRQHAVFFQEAAARSPTLDAIEFPTDVLLHEKGEFVRDFLCAPPNVTRVVSPLLHETVLDGIAERHERLGTTAPEHTEIARYDVSDFSFRSFVRLARFLRTTNLPLAVHLRAPRSESEKRIVRDHLQGKTRFTVADVDWIAEQDLTNRKKRRDAALCPHCGRYDPHGTHFVVFRYRAGVSMYRCQVEEITEAARRKKRRLEEPPLLPSDGTIPGTPDPADRSGADDPSDADDTWSVPRCT